MFFLNFGCPWKNVSSPAMQSITAIWYHWLCQLASWYQFHHLPIDLIVTVWHFQHSEVGQIGKRLSSHRFRHHIHLSRKKLAAAVNKAAYLLISTATIDNFSDIISHFIVKKKENQRKSLTKRCETPNIHLKHKERRKRL